MTALPLRQAIWASLIPHAIPDSRYNFDFSLFTPDFRSSEAALERICALECYQNASTLYIGPDNSLTSLRVRALRDGKKVLVTSYAMRRGFWLLDPKRIDVDANEKWKFEVAGLMDGMEKPGFGRRIGLAELRDEKLTVDLFVSGSAVVEENTGSRLGEGKGWSDLVWGILKEVGLLKGEGTAVATLVHDCQVIDQNEGEEHAMEKIKRDVWDVALNYIITPTRVIEIPGATKPGCGILWENLTEEAIRTIPPLQELKGIQMMDSIMSEAARKTAEFRIGMTEEKSHVDDKEEKGVPNEYESMGISIVERLMKGYKS